MPDRADLPPFPVAVSEKPFNATVLTNDFSCSPSVPKMELVPDLLALLAASLPEKGLPPVTLPVALDSVACDSERPYSARSLLRYSSSPPTGWLSATCRFYDGGCLAYRASNTRIGSNVL